jgi:C4-dicarboxylate-specific signal transduction histidine kinase
VSDRAISPDDLILLLERVRLPSTGAKPSSDVTLEQVDALIARIASLTDALRGAADDKTAQLASRILIGDLAIVAAQFRGRANELVAELTRARDDLRGEVDDTGQSGARDAADSPGAR